MPYEDHKPIYLCREPKFDLRKYWLVDRKIKEIPQKNILKEG
jgi:hypothetical protein